MRKPTQRPREILAVLTPLAVLALAAATAVPGSAAVTSPEGRNFDARVQHNQNLAAPVNPQQAQAVARARSRMPALTVSYGPDSSAPRTLYNRTGYLTPPSVLADPLEAARAYIESHRDLLGLSLPDLEHEVTDIVFSKVTGATHIYLRQVHQGIPVYNGQLSVTVNRDGRILGVNNAFVPHLARAAAANPALLQTPEEAVARAAAQLGLSTVPPARLLAGEAGPRRLTRLTSPGLSRKTIEAGLMWLPVREGDVRLVWNFQIDVAGGDGWYDFTVDAGTGEIWTRFDWVSDDSHRVVPQPFESPAHLPVPPPADGRTVVANPADPVASPSGWFNDGVARTITRGNNVNAYEDSNATNSPSAGQPDCGPSLVCDFDFPIDFGNQAPSTYRNAAVSNLFYWNNTIHDIQYAYGFDEAAGNFQEQNFGRGGLGSDAVQAEAQDGAGSCNANFATPTDGFNPRMQMFTCANVLPARDGDFDSAVIVHEYGHGISIRQVGGPSNSSCLNNLQQGGEGYSDWWGLVYTAQAGDLGTDARGIGTYLFGQPPNGPGIRVQPYSTDPAVNNFTYASVAGMSVPHGVGSVWAQAAWEVYWALVGVHGFDPNLANALGGAGNQRAMLYVNEGMKNAPCSPSFTDMRDAIIQAAVDNFAGADVCLLWSAFAGFGLGVDAVSGGPNSLNPINGFQMPPECGPGGNTAPVVAITSPANGSTFPTGAVISFAGTATDAEDGVLTAALAWTSNIDGAIGAGGAFSRTLSAGSHTITASVTDSGGLVGSDAITVTVAAPDTVSIGKAQWDSRKGELSIEGTVSSTTSTLTATFGGRTEPVTNDRGRFKERFGGVATNPVTVTVTSSGGGSDTVAVTVK